MLSADEYGQILKFLPYGQTWRLASVDKQAADACKCRLDKIHEAIDDILEDDYVRSKTLRKYVYKYNIHITLEILVIIGAINFELFKELYDEYVTNLQRFTESEIYEKLTEFKLKTPKSHHFCMSSSLNLFVERKIYEEKIVHIARFSEFDLYETYGDVSYEIDMAAKYKNMEFIRKIYNEYAYHGSPILHALKNNKNIEICNIAREIEHEWDVDCKRIEDWILAARNVDKLRWCVNIIKYAKARVKTFRIIINRAIALKCIDIIPAVVDRKIGILYIDNILKAAIEAKDQSLYQLACDLMMNNKASISNDTYEDVEYADHACCTKYMRMVFKYHIDL